jgi:hypothetical protein
MTCAVVYISGSIGKGTAGQHPRILEKHGLDSTADQFTKRWSSGLLSSPNNSLRDGSSRCCS